MNNLEQRLEKIGDRLAEKIARRHAPSGNARYGKSSGMGPWVFGWGISNGYLRFRVGTPSDT